MTINTFQGQSLKVVGLSLAGPVFSHGQLYVGTTRVGNPDHLFIVAPQGKTKNYCLSRGFGMNKVDTERVALVGPDRACAEWILRSGGKIVWKGMNHVEKDYNSLPLSNFSRYKVETIDATDTAVMNIGFHHLEGLKDLKKLILKDCNYLDDDALNLLHYVKDTLEHLEISNAGNVTQRGLNQLPLLLNLQYLFLSHLPEIRKKKECLEHLRHEMPQCDIHFPEAEPQKSATGDGGGD